MLHERHLLKMNQHGQVILFVVVAMVIALGLGIAVSARTLTSLSRVTDTDTSARILAAAEGGAERMLQRNYSTFKDLVDNHKCETLSSLTADVANAAANGCLITFEYSPTLKNRAFVTVNDMDPTAEVSFSQLTMADVKEVRVNPTENIRFCWTSSPGNNATALFAGYAKEASGVVVKTKGAITPVGGPGTLQINSTGGFTPLAGFSDPGQPYTQCSPNINPSGATRMRFRPVGGQIEKGIILATGGHTLPSQGYAIVSYGEMEQGGKKIQRAIRVTKTFPYAAYSVFDYAIYSDQGDVKTN